MAFIIGTTVAVLFLDGPLKIVLIAVVALIEILELSIWLRWRKVRATTGVEAMVGAEGVAMTDVDPEGRVKLKGMTWKARSNVRVAAGDPVRVVAVEGLRLDVTPR